MSLLDIFELLLKLLIICFCLLHAGGAAACSFKAQVLGLFYASKVALKPLVLMSNRC